MRVLAFLGLCLAQDPVTQGLELRFDAQSFSATWPDASGHRRDLTGASPPRYERPVVRFDGVDDCLSVRGLKLSPKELTLFIVAAPHENPGGFRALASANAPGKNDYTTGFNIDLGGGGSDDLSWINVEGAGFPGEKNLMKGSAPLGTFHVLTMTSAAAVRLYVDGVQTGQRPRKAGAHDLSEFRLGARHYSNAAAPTRDEAFFRGDIAEVLLYSRLLGDDERRAVEAYLSKKHEPLLKRKAPHVEPPPAVEVIVPGFTVRKLPVQITNINNLEYAADGRLFALGYDGRVHVLIDSDGDGLEDQVKPYWYASEGDLRGPIGMALTAEGLIVASKGRVSLIRDVDGDGTGDRCDVIATGWKEITQNVDAVGVALDAQGNLYFGLGCADFTNAYLVDKEGKSRYDLKSERGTILKVSPDRSKREIVCTGVRFPVALAFNRHGDLFATDQEGETWLPGGNPLDELLHILPERHYGFPPRHDKHLPDVVDEPAVVTFGPQHQSTCGLKFNEGRRPFGPAAWEGDALVAGESRGKIWRVPLVKTRAGYVGRKFLIASLRMLTVDIAVSPKGDLAVTCHSGKPDWGTGPKGPGSLFKISYTDPAAPQPVEAWASGPLEVRVAFDRPVDLAKLGDASIVYGEYASAGDRLEVLSPPYKVVEEQKKSPRRTLGVAGKRLSEDGRTLILSTAPHPWRATYALTLHGPPAIDLEYDLSGVEASWTEEGKDAPAWTGWLPHPDPAIFRAPVFDKPGRLSIRGRLDLTGTVRFESDRVLEIKADRSDFRFDVRTGGGPLRLDASYHTDADPRERPIPVERFLVPWAPLLRPPRPAIDAKASPLAGGNWEKGREIFFGGETKCSACHKVRGEGGAFAPDLSNLVHRDAASVLRDVVEPSAAINPDYVNHVVELRDGRILAGVIFTDGAERLRIVDAGALETVVTRQAIRQLRPSATSIMPDAYKALGDEKLRDLLTFLTVEQGKGAPPPRGRAEVEAVLAKSPKPEGKPRPLEILLVAGPKDHGPGEHDYPVWQAQWKPLLGKAEAVKVDTAFKWPSPEQWAAARVVVMYFANEWSAGQLEQVDAFLARGGGLVLIHMAVIPKGEAGPMAARIGLAWQWKKSKFRHGALDLKIEAADHPIVRGLPEKMSFVDESYWPLVEGDMSRVKVLATTVEDGKPQPMFWTVTPENGRVFCSILGHYAWSFDDPFFRLLLLRGIAWSAAEPETRFDALSLDMTK